MIIDTQTRPKIKELSPITISRIAAGEVLERPASAIKELVENALDAGSTEITIKVEAGGKNLILVSDNGCGMTKESLSLAVERHTTSKLVENDLLNIQYFGFRGEALPSIGSISRMTIKSRPAHQEDGYAVRVVGGAKYPPEPVAHHSGTTVEVRDLFYATPARLKFLRSDKTEIQQSVEIVKKIALAHTNVAFKFYVENKLLLNFPISGSRINDVVGKEFIANSVKIDVNRDGIKLSGHTSLPTYNGSTTDQYLYVNKRSVKDKLLLAAVRIAYQEFIGKDKHPAVVLFLDVPYEMVDVNVHPSKTEVRFRDLALVRDTVIAGLKHALHSKSDSILTHRAQPTELLSQSRGAINLAMSGREKIYPSKPLNIFELKEQDTNTNFYHSHESTLVPGENCINSVTAPTRDVIPAKAGIQNFVSHGTQESLDSRFRGNDKKVDSATQPKLGVVVAQIEDAYIITQAEDGLVLIDQRAAHECLTYEELKKGPISKQRLSIPEVIELDHQDVDQLLEVKDMLSGLGLQIDYCTSKSVVVTEIPEFLSTCDIKKLLQDVTLNIKNHNTNVLCTYASYKSTSNIKKMTSEEIHKLLNDLSNITNPIRKTHVKLGRKDIERMFVS